MTMLQEMPAGCTVPFDVERIRADFPILNTMVYGKPLVYFDNAATTHKPRMVIDSLSKFYCSENSNVHRGVHLLSIEATKAYEGARAKVRRFLNAREEREIVFVRGATEGINLIAQSFVRKRLRKGDEILISALEHHSNIVPWQMICEEREAVLRVIPVNDKGELLLDEYEKLLNERTRVVSIIHVSNALGTVNPVKEIVRKARAMGIPVIVDGAQAVQHMVIDVQEIDCDFYVFSGHKIFGPTGIGVLYGRASLLEEMSPYQGGGEMIKSVTFEKTIYNDIPYKFEAGTPNIAGAVGLGTAIDYVTGIGVKRASTHVHKLLSYATDALSKIPGVRIIGTAKEKAAVLSFVIDNIHPHDIGTIIDREGVAIRTGNHCAQPALQRFGLPATARASFAMYNTIGEIDILVKAIHKAIEVFHM